MRASVCENARRMMKGPMKRLRGGGRRIGAGALWRQLPGVLFVTGIALGALAWGWFASEQQRFPDQLIRDGLRTLKAAAAQPTVEQLGFLGFTDVPAEAPLPRIRFQPGADRLAAPVLWPGGRFWFRDLCPDGGCVAVAYTAAGEVAHAYPWRPAEVGAAWRAVTGVGAAAIGAANGGQHELAFGYHFPRNAYPGRVLAYANADVLVTLRHRNAFPYPAGVARLAPDGRPRWVRRDFSHHSGQLDRDGNVMIPALRLGANEIALNDLTLTCPNAHAHWSLINFIDGRGQLRRSMELTGAVVDSPYAVVLKQTKNACDPLQLNYVHRLGPDAGGAWGIAPGDIVASLRNVSALAVLDGETGRVKRLAHGSFHQQHSVTHYRDAKFLLFDNYGGASGSARVLLVDLADGRETTVFPNEHTPAALRHLASDVGGHLDIAPDGGRALATFSQAGVAVEIGLPSGELHAVFTALHDVSGLAAFAGKEARAERAAKSSLAGLTYIRSREQLPAPFLPI